MHDESRLIKSSDLPFDGGTVLAEHQSDRRRHLAFVLAQFADKYVVWTVNLQDHRREKRGGFFNGAYFTDADERTAGDEATAEYQFRCKEG